MKAAMARYGIIATVGDEIRWIDNITNEYWYQMIGRKPYKISCLGQFGAITIAMDVTVILG